MNGIGTKLRKKPESLRMLNLLVKREVAEGLQLLAREARMLPDALVPTRGGYGEPMGVTLVGARMFLFEF